MIYSAQTESFWNVVLIFLDNNPGLSFLSCFLFEKNKYSRIVKPKKKIKKTSSLCFILYLNFRRRLIFQNDSVPTVIIMQCIYSEEEKIYWEVRKS